MPMPSPPATPCEMRAEAAIVPVPPALFQVPPARRFHIVLPGCALAVRRTLQDARGHCWRAGLSEDDCTQIELLLAEVLNNIVEHALRDHPDGVIELELSLGRDCADVRVSDDGAPMPQAFRPDMRNAALGPDPADLPEGGFGWDLIRQLARNLTYERRSGWNRLTLGVPLDRPGMDRS